MTTNAIMFRKEVSTLPSQLEPNTVYFVRVGTGFDLYVSDATGSIAHAVNGGSGGSGGGGTTLASYGINDAYTKTEVDTALTTKADLVDGVIPASQLPAYVDSVVEYADIASLPVPGMDSKIYVTIDTNKTYRWSGTQYVEISESLALGETAGSAYRGDRGAAAYEHSLLKTGNPHQVTKDDVGLSNVDNTSDASKPISTAVQTALNAKEGSVTAGTAAQYYRGDKTWQNFGTEALGAVLAGLTTSNTAIANGNTLITALGRLQGQISSMSPPNKFNVDLSYGASAANCYFDDSYYHLFASGTLTVAGAAQFPRLPLVASFAEAKAHAAMVAGLFHRWLIAFGGENDTTFDQLASSQAATSGLFSGTTFLGGLSTGTTDVDEQPINVVANEFFIIPVARDASYIYYITAAYSTLTAYAANYGNKIVCFYNGQEGSGAPVAPTLSSGHSNQFSVRYATSLAATASQSVWMQLTVKKRNG